ncbi:hypothetical protein [Gracilinema caldarium]|uniref:Uncharacterized protein n=1 Tax=Gracilinema caldarium (strain ATCC 51460 / DSM 7334 / H1) TaxID=744872 RepID=F8EXC5_GRAC1|nr:hypothetical protein [Gracilinema caldarium]AEJ19152.1 hypothetical protein Spica_1002 [Gracilinema caldarium DSM 7334]
MMNQLLFTGRHCKNYVLAGFLILSLIIFGIVSCELFKEDYFPAYLSQAQAVKDLTSITKAAGISALATVGFLQFIPVPAIQKTYIVLGLHQISGPPAIVLLDSSDLSVIKAFTNLPAIGKFAMLDMNGYIATAYENTRVIRIDPVALTLNLFDPVNNTPYFSQTGFSLYSLSITTAYLCEMRENDIALSIYNNDWAFSILYAKDTFFDNQPASQFSLLDLYYDGTRIYMALNNRYTNKGYILRWDVIAQFTNDFTSATYIGENAQQILEVPVSKEEGAFLTSAGYIVQFNDDRKGLGRYAMDRDNTELDRFLLPNEFRGKISFAPDGSRWLLYDEQKGSLALLRPWW